MADSTVAPSGGDFTTLAAALSDSGTGNGDTITIEGDWTSDSDTTEAEVQDDNITIVTSSTGGARHAGFYNGTTNWELNTSGNDHSLTISNTGCKLDGVVIVQSGTGNSDEVVHLDVDGTYTVVDSILRCANNRSDQDCLYGGTITATVNCENVICIGAGRAGFNAQLSSAGAADTLTFNLISCTAWNNGRFSAEPDGGGVNSQARNSSSVVNINGFNCLFVGNTSASSEDYNNATGTNNGTRNWALDRCGEDSNSPTITTLDGGAVGAISFETITDGTPGVTDDVVAFNDITSAPYDLRLQDHANNDAQDVHSDSTGAGLTFGDYVGSSVDIAGTTRPQNTDYDLGPFEVVAAGGSTTSVASPQVITLSPQGPTVQAGKRIDVSAPETIVLSPQGPTIQAVVATNVDVEDAAVLTLSPQGPTLRTGAAVSVSDVAELLLQAQNPTIQAGARVAVEAPLGLLIQPQGPIIRTGASVLVSAPQPILIQPQGPTLRTGASIPVAAPQGLILDPIDPTIRITGPVSVADAVVLTLQPQGPTIDAVIATRVDVEDPQGLTLTPFGPTVRTGASVLVDDVVGILVQALDPTLLSGVTIAVDSQPILIQPQGPSVQAGSAVFVQAPASMTIQPHGPTLQSGSAVILEDPVGLLIGPQGPAVQAGVSVSVSDAGVITLTMPGPNIQATTVVGAEVEAPVCLTLVPSGPTVSAGAVAVARRYSVHRGKGTRFSKGVRDHVFDVGTDAVSIDSEDIE